MKPYNTKKWWIDSGIIREITIEANTITAAIKTKSPMYRDTKTGEPVQVGFVITASTDFDNDRKGWIKQFIDLWVDVNIISNPFEGVR